jgi:hypothetical protein
MPREENSVLFSLNHLRDMAAATASAGGFIPAPVARREESNFESLYVGPSAIAPSVLLASIGPQERPRWLIPAIAGVGSLLLVFLALVLVLVLHQPDPQVSVVKATPAVAPILPSPAASPQGTEPTKAASAVPAPLEDRSTADEGKAKEPQKLAKGKRGKRGKLARLSKRGKRGKRSPMIAAAAAPKPKKQRAHRRDALDDLLDQALK